VGWLNQLKISLRLALGFGTMLALCLAIVVTAWVQIRVMGDAASNLGGNTVPSLTILSRIQSGLLQVRRSELNLALADGDDIRREAESRRAKGWADFHSAHAEYGNSAISDDEDRRLWKEISAASDAYDRESNALLTQLAAETDPSALQRIRRAINSGSVRKAVEVAMSAVDEDWRYNLKLKDEAVATAAAADRTARTALTVVAVLAALAGIVATVVITRSIVGPINEAVAAATRVADGDLTARLTVRGNDELADLTRAQQSMIERLSVLIRALKTAADQIETGASEVAVGSADLSARTEQQAASLEESSASLEDLSGTVKHNAEHAGQDTNLAVEASDVAARGGQAVREVVAVMQDIETSSRQVEAIVSVIDGISFQTNILALNAAVEAARAGDQGRGFAVVASEVRTLAQRSAQAAKEIKGLISASADKVGAGSERVAVAGRTIDDVVTRVERVGGLIREIGAATREQTAGIDQVTQAVSQLDAMTQQNAALVEQSTAAADSLRSQARQLAQAVAQFKVA